MLYRISTLVSGQNQSDGPAGSSSTGSETLSVTGETAP